MTTEERISATAMAQRTGGMIPSLGRSVRLDTSYLGDEGPAS